jgi:hypothetical protein
MGVFDAVTPEAALQLCHDALVCAGGDLQDASERLWEQQQGPDPDPAAPSLHIEPSSLVWSIVLKELNTRRLVLTNPSIRCAVCCRVQTTRRYAASPVMLCIPANGSATVEITMFAMNKLPNANDRKDLILVKAAWQQEPATVDQGRFWLERQGAHDDVSQALVGSDIAEKISPYSSGWSSTDEDTSDSGEESSEDEESGEEDDGKLERSRTLSVEAYGGQELTAMYHGTDSRAAQLIATSQRFRPSMGGLLGDGVYVTQTRQKAEGYRVHHPNAAKLGAKQRNTLLPSGEKDPGK